MDSNPPDSSVHGISQARILEWVAISFSRGSSRPRDWTHVSCIDKQVLYHLSHKQSPIWVYPKSNERVLKRKKSRERKKWRREEAWIVSVVVWVFSLSFCFLYCLPEVRCSCMYFMYMSLDHSLKRPNFHFSASIRIYHLKKKLTNFCHFPPTPCNHQSVLCNNELGLLFCFVRFHI